MYKIHHRFLGVPSKKCLVKRIRWSAENFDDNAAGTVGIVANDELEDRNLSSILNQNILKSLVVMNHAS